ncbi:phosphotransferase family protein [Streptomyces sp. HMX87]|uniref:phosphotransferase family protein n=1 Tax=Streptomyces sp. HMX87 TaxID=3390849 RepID=UPI003A87659D
MAARIAQLALTDPGQLGLPGQAPTPSSNSACVQLLGEGESYRVWRLDVAGHPPLAVRVARRALQELPRPMHQEFAALSQLPDGIGPSPVLLNENPDSPLGAPYMVCGYVPGRVPKPAQWSDSLLHAHARQLSRFHARAFPRCGDIGAPAAEQSAPLSLVSLFEESLAWWQGRFPHMLRSREIGALLSRVEAFVTAAEPAFRRLDRFALIHGDLVVPNIVVDDVGTPRYVDWEWAQLGDPAQDLAYIGGHVPAAPWYLQLDRTRIHRLLTTYLRYSPDAGMETLDQLAMRRDAWEVYERFFSCLHFRTRRSTPEDRRSGLYTRVVAQLTAGLDARLSP